MSETNPTMQERLTYATRAWHSWQDRCESAEAERDALLDRSRCGSRWPCEDVRALDGGDE